MKQLLIIFIVLYFSFLSQSSAQSPPDSVKSDIKLRTFVEKESIPLNREVIYIVQLTWTGELNRYKINQVMEPDATNLVIRGTGSSNKVTTNPDGSIQSTKRITFYFKPVEMGMAYINGVTIRYEDAVMNQKESLLATRIGVKIIDPIPESSSNMVLKNFILYGLILLIIVAFLYFFWLYKKKRKEAILEEQSTIVETTEEKYTRLLKETIHISGNNLKEKLNDLVHLLTGYFSEKYDHSLSKMSTPDLLNYIEGVDLPSNLLEKIKDFYSRSDLIRFAGKSITETEFHQLYDSVEWIIEKNKKEETEEEDK